MSDTGNQGNQNAGNGGTPNVSGGNQGGGAKTFTQEEIDQIVEARLGRERAKYSDYEELAAKAKQFDEQEEANKSELEKYQDKYKKAKDELDTLKKKNQVLDIRKKVSEATGVPVELLPYDTEEENTEYAKRLSEYKNPEKDRYPGVGTAGNHRSQPGSNQSSDEHEAARELAHQLFGKGE